MISVVILSRNEESNIERCLRSVLWADEILLLDSSSDDTVKKAKKIGGKRLRVVSSKTTSNFSALRNRALTESSNEWVLFLDADEEVPTELRKEILKVLDFAPLRSNSKVVGYYLKRKDYFLGKWLKYGETGNIKHLKLGKKSAGKWRRRVHEVWEIRGKIGELTTPLNHYPHPTISEFLTHINRWTDLDAQEFYDHGVRSSWWKIIVYPKAKFLRNYVIKLGFLDGMPGFIMALLMSLHSFLTRAKLYMLQNVNTVIANEVKQSKKTEIVSSLRSSQ